MFRVGASGTTEEADDSTESADILNVSAKSPIVNGLTNPSYTAERNDNASSSRSAAVGGAMNGAMHGVSAADTVIDASTLLGRTL